MSQYSLHSGLEWARHVHSDPLDFKLEWKNCAMTIREKVEDEHMILTVSNGTQVTDLKGVRPCVEGAKGLSSSRVSWTRMSHYPLLSGLEWARHVHSDYLDLEWKIVR
jgi:hypothetical protein